MTLLAGPGGLRLRAGEDGGHTSKQLAILHLSFTKSNITREVIRSSRHRTANRSMKVRVHCSRHACSTRTRLSSLFREEVTALRDAHL